MPDEKEVSAMFGARHPLNRNSSTTRQERACLNTHPYTYGVCMHNFLNVTKVKEEECILFAFLPTQTKMVIPDCTKRMYNSLFCVSISHLHLLPALATSTCPFSFISSVVHSFTYKVTESAFLR
ncbi:hypothetical protein POVWA2_097070 [Plasmodium ovale wallikeri]|uniref:Uncharacterized protein n=1 Tax=Plasmodium ovale wallikeri TaxID=864142 RepID=A0A1A9ARX7_PLAOA|nr:hypothetical protein POVWA1_019100 [Plasmodium ovale wallikeri]SBT59480.1 hypothetical protein POVWA2_097070 [Plasmodium ovale wallikeri]